jgi:hypothetical protein
MLVEGCDETGFEALVPIDRAPGGIPTGPPSVYCEVP